MSEWTLLPDAAPYAEEFVVTELDLITEITHPMRSAILFRLRHPQSAAELAASMDVPVTRLYHHLNHLEQRGLISVVATRRSGAKTERRYRNVARRFRLDTEAVERASSDDVVGMLSAMFDVTKSELIREFTAGAMPPEQVRSLTTSGINQLRLTKAKRDELVDRVWALLEEYVGDDEPDDHDAPTGDDPDTFGFRVFVAGFPISS